MQETSLQFTPLPVSASLVPIRDSDGTLLCKVCPQTGEVELEVRRHGRRLRRMVNPQTLEVAEMRPV